MGKTTSFDEASFNRPSHVTPDPENNRLFINLVTGIGTGIKKEECMLLILIQILSNRIDRTT